MRDLYHLIIQFNSNGFFYFYPYKKYNIVRLLVNVVNILLAGLELHSLTSIISDVLTGLLVRLLACVLFL